jgi:hypothetical protein
VCVHTDIRTFFLFFYCKENNEKEDDENGKWGKQTTTFSDLNLMDHVTLPAVGRDEPDLTQHSPNVILEPFFFIFFSLIFLEGMKKRKRKKWEMFDVTTGDKQAKSFWLESRSTRRVWPAAVFI